MDAAEGGGSAFLCMLQVALSSISLKTWDRRTDNSERKEGRKQAITIWPNKLSLATLHLSEKSPRPIRHVTASSDKPHKEEEEIPKNRLLRFPCVTASSDTVESEVATATATEAAELRRSIS